MRRPLLLIAAAAALGALSFTVYEAQAITRLRGSLATDHTRLAQQEQQLVELRRERDDAQRDLQSAEEILAEDKLSEAASVVKPPREVQILQWLTRAKRLKRSFEEHPEQIIPEFQLLNDLDWLTLAQSAKLESADDFRKTWSEARESAFSKLSSRLQPALRDFGSANSGAQPSELSQLLPYIKSTIDPAILQRYEIAERSGRGTRGVDRVLTERAPVDPDYDPRHTLSLDGRGSGSSLWALERFREAYDNASREFTTANARRPSGEAELLPYVRDPQVKAIYEAKAAHQVPDGKEADLRPFITDPDSRALLEKMIGAYERRTAR